MGLIAGIGATSPVFAFDHYYGVEWDTEISDPTLTRVGKMDLHAQVPIQSKMRRCILTDAGEVAYYLHPTDSTKTESSADADLTGAAGQVMVEVPKHYRRYEMEGTKRRMLISEFDLPGFTEIPKFYIGAYEAAVHRPTNKLSSVMNTTADYRGGNNNAANDANANSLLGMPATAISMTNFRAYAQNRGVNWCQQLPLMYYTVAWLFYIEHATLNSQLAVNPTLTGEGYRQGGLGNGMTNANGTEWNNFNGYYPFIPCGSTNSMGNATGEVSKTIVDFGGIGVARTFKIPSYRGVENPFGHLWKWLDGINIYNQTVEEGGKSLAYFNNNIATLADNTSGGYTSGGELVEADGYVKKIIGGEGGLLLPVAGGASTSIYFCDYYWTSADSAGYGWRALRVGASAYNGGYAGFACSYSYYSASYAIASIGSRLCFLGA